MNAPNLSPNGPHRHLDEEALWEMAEAMVLEAKDGAAQETETIALAQACPLCAPKLQAARSQIAVMRALPEIKAPPDFLLLVQSRIEAENIFLKRLLATLRSWVMPKRAVGVPMGFASAMLLVLVLIVVMPRQENKDEATDQPAGPMTQEAQEVYKAHEDDKANEDALSQKAEKSKTVSAKKRSVAKDEIRKEERAKIAEWQDSPKPRASASSVAPSPIESESPLAMALESPASPAGSAPLAAAPARAMARSRLSERADLDAKSESQAESKADASEAREVFIKRAGKLSPLPLQHLGDTLLFVANKQHALTLGQIADSLGLASKTHAEVRGDSVYFRLLP